MSQLELEPIDVDPPAMLVGSLVDPAPQEPIATPQGGGFEESLSVEELAILNSEANDDAEKVRKTVEQSQRMLQIADALDELADNTENIRRATRTEVDLIKTSARMAVAGTGTPPEALIPSIESYLGGKVATEGYRDTAKQLLKTVVESVKKSWDSLENFFKANIMLPTLLTRIVALEKRASNMGAAKPDRATVRLRISQASLSCDGQLCTKGSKLKEALRNTKEAVDYVFGTYPDNLTKRVELVIKAMTTLKPENPRAAIEQLAKDMKANEVTRIPKAGTPMTVGNYQQWSGAPLLGNVNLTMKTMTGEEKMTVHSYVRNQRWSSVSLSTRESPAVTSDVLEIERLSADEIKNLLSTCRAIMVDMDAFVRRGPYVKLKSQRKRMEAATQKLWEMKTTDKMEGSMAGAFYPLAGLNSGMVAWIQNPIVPMFQKALASVRAVVAACAASVDAYEVKEA